jgi:hypothetical protein
VRENKEKSSLQLGCLSIKAEKVSDQSELLKISALHCHRGGAFLLVNFSSAVFYRSDGQGT